MEESARARRVNNLVGRFYRAAVSAPLERFRETMLRDLATVVPFDAALWGTGDARADRFHSLTLLGLDERFTRRTERTLDLEPGFEALVDGWNDPPDAAELIPDEAMSRSGIQRSICEPFGIPWTLGSRYRDSRSGLHTLLVLFRFDRGHRFDADERRIQQHLSFHLLNAVSLAYSVYLAGVCARDVAKSAAICDRFGVCYETQPSFTHLVAEKFPEWRGPRLPFEMPDPPSGACQSVNGLQVVFEPVGVGDLVCVRAWREGPMDLLTNREREIVDSVCHGLSYKEVARPLGIAPSTVSNHLYRVFEKLGVSSRTELAKLVSRWRQLH